MARALGADTPNARQGGRVKVVYRVNLRDPNDLFLAQRMRILNRDFVYVSNAMPSDVQKFTMLFNLMASPVGQRVSLGYTASRIAH